jgi:hypothetical protein
VAKVRLSRATCAQPWTSVAARATLKEQGGLADHIATQ